MTPIFASAALLDDGFARNVRITASNGDIETVTPDTTPDAGDQEVSGLLLPGMPDLHSHAFQRAFAGLSEFDGGGGDFWTWRDAMYRTAARITPETCTAITTWLGKELLKGGYTSLVEFHYLHHQSDGASYAPATTMAQAVAEGAAAAGIGLTLLVGVYESAGFDGAPLTGGQNRFRNGADSALAMAATLRAAGLTTGLALHSLRAVRPATLRQAATNFAGLGPIHIHAAEQRAEVEACIAALGAPPVAWLLDNAPLDRSWCLVHATHTTAVEIAAAARAGAVIGLCPATEADLGDGIFDLSALLDASGQFGIGSDSNVLLDAFAELRLLEYGQRLRGERRNVAACDTGDSTRGGGHSGRALWQAATRGGAHASGRPIGRIAPTHRADFVAVDPTLESAGKSADFMLDAAIFATARPPARHVMAGGVWQVRDYSHRNESAIDAAYRAALKTLAL
jgi:formimidoylglutamate deiminase